MGGSAMGSVVWPSHGDGELSGRARGAGGPLRGLIWINAAVRIYSQRAFADPPCTTELILSGRD